MAGQLAVKGGGILGGNFKIGGGQLVFLLLGIGFAQPPRGTGIGAGGGVGVMDETFEMRYGAGIILAVIGAVGGLLSV